jgi:Insecticide toxin TcdB middle/N-terminal region
MHPNGFVAAHTLNIQFPHIDELSSVIAVDLLGNGTSCLVWSSLLPSDIHRSMRYIDFMGGQKPHLMTLYRNGMGEEVHLEYKPSTYYYLTDKLVGKQWVTRIPFPVYCISKVIVKDHIRETTFVTSYTYHHGHYDGIEREFRGFDRERSCFR